MNISTKQSFVFLQFEAVLTSLMISMPVINLVFNDIGMSQLQVGITQAVFMTTALLFDVPTGWFADKYSRKIINMGGDILVALGLLLYASAGSFNVVLISEIIVAIGIAATNGADAGLLKAHADALKLDYTKVSSKLAAIKPAAMVLGVLFAGWLGASNIRWPFLASAGFFVLGAIASLFIKEIGVRRVTEKHPIRDMLDIGKFTFSGHAKLRWRVFSGVFAGNSTHTAVFLLIPIFLAVGYSEQAFGYIWALMWISNSLGAFIARKFHSKLTVMRQIMVPTTTVLLSYLLIGAYLTSSTVWLYLVLSLVFGWFTAIINPLIQQSAPDDIQSTVISFSSVLRRLFYIPLVIIINLLGGLKLEYAMLGSFVIYAIFAAFIYKGLRETERS